MLAAVGVIILLGLAATLRFNRLVGLHNDKMRALDRRDEAQSNLASCREANPSRAGRSGSPDGAPRATESRDPCAEIEAVLREAGRDAARCESEYTRLVSAFPGTWLARLGGLPGPDPG